MCSAIMVRQGPLAGSAAISTGFNSCVVKIFETYVNCAGSREDYSALKDDIEAEVLPISYIRAFESFKAGVQAQVTDSVLMRAVSPCSIKAGNASRAGLKIHNIL